MDTIFLTATFLALALLCTVLQLKQPKAAQEIGMEGFTPFQNSYLFVYCLMMAGDWLQGPYVYALYQHYGFGEEEIGKLFIAGFGASMVLGTCVGSLADKCGRKKAALVYCVTYIGSCITKHWNNYRVLLVGRVLGGISTSLLFSAFESWLVAEHFKRGFNDNLLGQTFTKTVFLGNGLVAILSGLFGNMLVEFLALGPVAPFDAAATLLAIGAVIIFCTWAENYGNTDPKIKLRAHLVFALDAIREDPRIALLGAMQGLFEGSMYTFVFLWTPALSPRGEQLSHGFIFSCFMVACMCGSSIAGYLMSKGHKPENYMKYTFGVACVSLFLPAAVLLHQTLAPPGTNTHTGLSGKGKVLFSCLLVFETTVGIFWPSMMKLRSQVIPEHLRSTLINFFRVPLNAFVCVVLFKVGSISLSSIFGVCSLFLCTAAICTVHLQRVLQSSDLRI